MFSKIFKAYDRALPLYKVGEQVWNHSNGLILLERMLTIFIGSGKETVQYKPGNSIRRLTFGESIDSTDVVKWMALFIKLTETIYQS